MTERYRLWYTESNMSSALILAQYFATGAHAGQKYGDGPYTTHLGDVAAMLAKYGHHDDFMQAAGWLHDVLEDIRVTEDMLVKLFGAPLASIVEAVTDKPGANRKARHRATYPGIRQHGTHAVALKLADRIANVNRARQTGDSRRMMMYRGEQDYFFKTLYIQGEHEQMWRDLGDFLWGTER